MRVAPSRSSSGGGAQPCGQPARNTSRRAERGARCRYAGRSQAIAPANRPTLVGTHALSPGKEAAA